MGINLVTDGEHCDQIISFRSVFVSTRLTRDIHRSASTPHLTGRLQSYASNQLLIPNMMNVVTASNLESTFQTMAASYPKDDLDERDFNKILDGNFYKERGRAFMISMTVFDGDDSDEEELEGELKEYAQKFGFEQHTNNWDIATRRFPTIPKHPRSADDLFDPLCGLMNKVLQGAGGRGNVVYFNPPVDLRRKRKDGKPWIKTDLSVVNYASMLKFRDEKARMESKAKAQIGRAHV